LSVLSQDEDRESERELTFRGVEFSRDRLVEEVVCQGQITQAMSLAALPGGGRHGESQNGVTEATSYHSADPSATRRRGDRSLDRHTARRMRLSRYDSIRPLCCFSSSMSRLFYTWTMELQKKLA
jgi:hypothetical protein